MLKCLNIVFTSMFSMECVLKIVAFGVLVGATPGPCHPRGALGAPCLELELPEPRAQTTLRGPITQVCALASSRGRFPSGRVALSSAPAQPGVCGPGLRWPPWGGPSAPGPS